MATQTKAQLAKENADLAARLAALEARQSTPATPDVITRTYKTDPGDITFEFQCAKGWVKGMCNDRTFWLRKTDFDVLMHVMRSEHIDDLYPLVSTHVRDITKKSKKVSKKRTRKAAK